MNNTRDRIIDAAINHFYENGYEGCTLRAIAECCGITHAAIYKHFKDKDALASELMRRFMLGLKEIVMGFRNEHGTRHAMLFMWAAQTRLLANDDQFRRLFISCLKNSTHFMEVIAYPDSVENSWLESVLEFHNALIPDSLAFASVLSITESLMGALSHGAITEKETALFLVKYADFLSGGHYAFDDNELDCLYNQYMPSEQLNQYDIKRDFLRSRFGKPYGEDPSNQFTGV